MDGQLALSRHRQGGRPAAAMPPLTERLLGRLPRPRMAWVLAWAAIPVAAGLLPGAYLATVGAKPITVRVLTGLVYAYAVVLAIWAVGRFSSESKTVERSVDQLAARPEQAAAPVFGGMASTRGPLARSVVFVVVTVWRTAVLGDLWVALLWWPVTLLVNLLLSLCLFLLGVGVFFGCLQGLHRQLLTARRHYLASAGQLYARASEPIRSGSLAALGEQAQPLQAAEVIQRRAEAIQPWPFQQRRLTQIAAIVGTVVTFVVTGIITRLILVRLGL